MTLADLEPFDPYSPAFRHDPYPLYRRLREQAPVHRSVMGGWFVSRASELVAALRSPSVVAPTVVPERFGAAGGQRSALYRMHRHALLFARGDHHGRLRGIVQDAFAPRRIRELRDRIEVIVETCLASLRDAPSFDLIEEFANPVPVSVISELLGIPAADRPRLRRWTQDLAGSFDMLTATPGTVARWNRLTVRFEGYLAGLLRSGQLRLGDARLAELAGDDMLSHDELMSLCMLLFAAGHQTTAHLIGNGIHLLDTRPELLQSLRRDPELLPAFVEEVLRYESSVQFSVREVVAPIVLDGRPIEPGDRLLIGFGAANRDPALFEEPDQFNLHHPRGTGFALGLGPHFCLGAALARLEAEIAFRALLLGPTWVRVLPHVRRWTSEVQLRGLTRLPVTFRA